MLLIISAQKERERPRNHSLSNHNRLKQGLARWNVRQKQQAIRKTRDHEKEAKTDPTSFPNMREAVASFKQELKMPKTGKPNQMSLHKHYVAGHASKSPRFRHALKREAEANERKDRSRLREPKSSVKELFE